MNCACNNLIRRLGNIAGSVVCLLAGPANPYLGVCVCFCVCVYGSERGISGERHNSELERECVSRSNKKPEESRDL